MVATTKHVIRPLRNRNPRIPVSNRFDGIEFDPLNMFENDEPTTFEEKEEDNEVDSGVQKVYQGFKYSHDPSYVVSSASPAPSQPLVHDLSPPTSPPLVENGFRNFLAMMMNWATAGWVFLFLGIGCCAFLILLQH